MMRFVHQVMAHFLSFFAPIFRIHISVSPPPPPDLELQPVTTQSDVAPAQPAPSVPDPSLPPQQHHDDDHPSINQEQLQLVSNHHLQNLQWDDFVMSTCFVSSIQIATCTSQPRIPAPLQAFSLAIAVTFWVLCIAKLTSAKFPRTSGGLKKVAIFIVAAAFYFVAAIPLPTYLKWVVSAVSVVSFLAILLCHFL